MADLTELQAHRETLVREHMESENRLDMEATLATFAHPRYELIATGQVYDGRGGQELLGQLTSHLPGPAQRIGRPSPF